MSSSIKLLLFNLIKYEQHFKFESIALSAKWIYSLVQPVKFSLTKSYKNKQNFIVFQNFFNIFNYNRYTCLERHAVHNYRTDLL